MGGGIRIVKADYFLDGSLRMRVDDRIMFGDGSTEMIYLEEPYMLTKQSLNVFEPLFMVTKILSERIKETKEKILGWLKEESLSPEDVADPNAYFNFGVKVSGSPLHVVQSVGAIDGVIVGANLILTPTQMDQLKSMDGKTRQEFFWDLRLALLKNNRLGDFQIKPDPPDSIQEVFVSSRRIFYDALTKDRLINAIGDVYRAVMMVIWMLERYAGVSRVMTDS